MTIDIRLARAESLIAAAQEQELALVLLGGAAVALLCASAQEGGRYSRVLGDVDLAAPSKAKPAVDRFLLASGLESDDGFNRMNGYVRLRYFDVDDSHVDVFLDELRLCHVVNWRKTVVAGQPTLPLTELLLTKLQVVELETKDLTDLCALLTDQWSAIDADSERLLRIVRDDWGLWRTGRGTLEKLASVDDPLVTGRAAQLLARWSAVRFTPKARARSLVGDRLRWYELPEEV
jgi:hypothetical protein